MFEVSRLNRLLIVVRSQEDADRAFSFARDEGGVSLINAEDTVKASGIRHFNRIVANAAVRYPGVGVEVVHDCSDSFSLALEALRGGAKIIKMTDDYRAYFKIIDIAEKFGAKVIRKANIKKAKKYAVKRNPGQPEVI